MPKWKRLLVSVVLMMSICTSAVVPVGAKDGFLPKVVDDNQQQIAMLSEKSPSLYCMMITPNEEKRLILKQLAEEITEKCETDEAKTKEIYKWVTQNIYYDVDGAESNHLPAGDPYSVYKTRLAVCEGFATLFAELMNAVGIPCVTFHGSTIGDPLGVYMDEVSGWNFLEYDQVDHAWNAVYLGGSWSYYDPTWDCNNKKEDGARTKLYPSRRYFRVSAERFASNHRTAYRTNDEGAFRLIQGEWRFCNSDGEIYTGVWYDDYQSALYYFIDGIPLTGRTVVDFQLIQFDDEGRYVETLYNYTGWEKYKGDWYYIHKGISCYGWGYFDGKWYYLDPKTSRMQTGWEKVDNVWYYFNGDGAMHSGWKKLNGYWFYLNQNGSMQTGWKLVKNQWYFFNGQGAMHTGWVKWKDHWYYMSSSGEMTVGWEKIKDHWYYFYEDGSMAADTVIDGQRLNQDGTF